MIVPLLCYFPIIFNQIHLLLSVTFLVELKLVLAVVKLTPEKIREELVKSEIIPDVILQSPPNVLQELFEPNIFPIFTYKQVTYPKWFIMKKFINFGTIISASKLSSPPTSIHWPYEEGARYTLILTSPDAPSRTNPSLREWQHWIVGNIRKNDVEGGETLTEYKAPGFVCKTGLHRMVFLVFKQPRKIAFKERKRRKRVLRSYFSTKVFSSKYNLGEPVAINYLQIDCGAPDVTTAGS